MSPVRLLILAGLLYLLWRLLRSKLGVRQRGPAPKTSSRGEVDDVLVEDPICHTLIPRGQAIRLRHEKTTYYFCSDRCCDRFIKSAQKERT